MRTRYVSGVLIAPWLIGMALASLPEKGEADEREWCPAEGWVFDLPPVRLDPAKYTLRLVATERNRETEPRILFYHGEGFVSRVEPSSIDGLFERGRTDLRPRISWKSRFPSVLCVVGVHRPRLWLLDRVRGHTTALAGTAPGSGAPLNQRQVTAAASLALRSHVPRLVEEGIVRQRNARREAGCPQPEDWTRTKTRKIHKAVLYHLQRDARIGADAVVAEGLAACELAALVAGVYRSTRDWSSCFTNG